MKQPTQRPREREGGRGKEGGGGVGRYHLAPDKGLLVSWCTLDIVV